MSTLAGALLGFALVMLGWLLVQEFIRLREVRRIHRELRQIRDELERSGEQIANFPHTNTNKNTTTK